MARYTGPVCKLCRREGQKLMLKGQKCYTEKCPIERRQYPPGQHGPAQARRRKQSDYALQLREKQFRSLFERANHIPGVTGENLLAALESRLDNIVFRMGFAQSRNQARQIVRHRHVEVNGRYVDVPSFVVSPGDEISIKAKSKNILPIETALDARTRPKLPEWLALDDKQRVGRMVRAPMRTDLDASIQEQLIVELYSK
jgi:small subunit ribosomal protein S4